MKKKFTLFAVVIFVCSSFTAKAQGWVGKEHTFSLNLGWSSMLGDLGGSKGIGTYGLKDVDYQGMSPVYGFGYSFTQNKKQNIGLALKVDFNYSRMNEADNFTTNEARHTRQLSRIVDVFELYAGMEFYFLKQEVSAFRTGTFKSKSGRVNLRSSSVKSGMPISMYLFTGAGILFSDCKGKYTDGKWYSLRKLDLEGQSFILTRKQHKLCSGVGVLGLGIKRVFVPTFAMKLEAGMRLTTTDYIDDISTTYIDPDAVYNSVMASTNDAQKAEMAKYFADGLRLDETLSPGQIRGNALKNDAYFFVELGFCYVLSDGKKTVRNSFR